MVDLDCGHTYHAHCAKKWVLDSRTCPSCRKSITPVKKHTEVSTAVRLDETTVDLLTAMKTIKQPKVVIDAPLPEIASKKTFAAPEPEIF